MDATPDFSYGDQITEQTPQFIGGTDSLRQFISHHLTYPQWEKEHKIEGRILVSFTVDTSGNITDPVILQRVEGSRNFDTEILRVVSLMPTLDSRKAEGVNLLCQDLPYLLRLS